MPVPNTPIQDTFERADSVGLGPDWSYNFLHQGGTEAPDVIAGELNNYSYSDSLLAAKPFLGDGTLQCYGKLGSVLAGKSSPSGNRGYGFYLVGNPSNVADTAYGYIAWFVRSNSGSDLIKWFKFSGGVTSFAEITPNATPYDIARDLVPGDVCGISYISSTGEISALVGGALIPGPVDQEFFQTEQETVYIGLSVNGVGGKLAEIGGGRVYVPASSPPANTVLPAISGRPEIGQVMTATTGVWSNNPLGYTYQWLRNGTPISAATGSTYTLQGADVGASISCVVTANNEAGSSQSSTGVVVPVAPPDIFVFTNGEITPAVRHVKAGGQLR
jgi:hypothetical protein